jgi:hypothetical protein
MNVNDILLRADFEAVKARFEKQFLRGAGADSCWVWQGRRYNPVQTYGAFDYGVTFRAHRASWVLYRGAIPAGLYVLHKCDNPPCVNPAHLFLGTHAENQADKRAKDRQTFGERNNAKLTETQVLAIRKDDRFDRVIAAEYGVSPRTINSVKNFHLWARVFPGQVKGETHGHAFLTESDIRGIYAASGLHREIAVVYGTTKSHVGKIKQGIAWKHLKLTQS